ncbi:hypothetical protein [Streptomyces sp. NBC_00055]|uniref:hypothetical protein n=1 Tax=Streptomyces sp. NBC_00055 TaxID=2975632 RepID=UPI00386A1A6E
MARPPGSVAHHLFVVDGVQHRADEGAWGVGKVAVRLVGVDNVAQYLVGRVAHPEPVDRAHGLCGPPRFDVVRPDRSGSRAEVLIAVSRIPARGAAGRKGG